MDDYLKFLYLIKMEPKTYKSNFAREFAQLAAEASSRGHITALNGAGIISGYWTLTASGTRLLKQHGRIQ
ncbi:hypothetical protein [Pseudomonas sp. SID14000]|uniref:hypothetical protein n=1 Tax=Pseudomonas sp. SID14000 TaxID=1986221 RepID=UPI000B3CAF39|nr:hypothetical protein [Pseudomonas sp. SID14000]